MSLNCFYLCLMILLGCSSGANSGSVKYYLEREATATKSNTLRLDILGNFAPKFSLSGTGFTADVALGEMLEAQDVTTLTSDDFGQVTINIMLFQENDRAYLSDSLTWKSSPEVPPVPEPYFSENASADAWVYLVLPSSKGKNVKEVWVEGDLDASVSSGKYYDIPNDDQVLLQLSEGDGIKNLQIRYRNIFGTDGDPTDLQIVRKSVGPQNCRANPVSSATATGSIRTRIQADNDGPLYYKIQGDIATEAAFIKFTDSVDEWIELSAGEGKKSITVKIKDAADNPCEDIDLVITYDRSYAPGAISIQGEPLWTDSEEIVILPQFDHLAGDDITMSISGGVLASATTFQWIPYTEQMTVTLTPTNGTRHVIVQFKKDSTVMSEVSVPIYLKPYVLINGTGAVVQIASSNIIGLSSMTVTGCSEAYIDIPYSASLTCTKSGPEASVTYKLTDGTSVTRSASF